MVVENSTHNVLRSQPQEVPVPSGALPFYASGDRKAASAVLRQGHRRILAITGWFFGLASILLLTGYVIFARSLSMREQAPGVTADAIVAVTGGSNRIGDAIELLQSRHGKRLLISGVNGKTGREELVRLNPAGRESIACCVDLDYRARNTIGNAIETRRWAKANKFGALLIVTSNYHLPRTMLEFQHAMPGMKLIGHPVVHEATPVEHWWRDLGVARIVGIEYMKYLTAWLRSSVESDPETSRLSVIVGGRKPVSPRGNDAIRPQDSSINAGPAASEARS
jgi:uncharacterized SAM-binding protein YcdF (DUF218 family)